MDCRPLTGSWAALVSQAARPHVLCTTKLRQVPVLLTVLWYIPPGIISSGVGSITMQMARCHSKIVVQECFGVRHRQTRLCAYYFVMAR